MNKILRNLLALVVLLGIPSGAFAQTQVDHTTFSTAVTQASQLVTLTANTGTVAGDFFYVEGELMRAVQNTTGTTWRVQRGMGEGFAPATGHPTTAIVWTGGGGEFRDFNRAGSCTAITEPYLPSINRKENRIFDCLGGTTGLWMERPRDRVNIQATLTMCGGLLRCRDEFNQGYMVFKQDGTVKGVADTDVNLVAGSPLGMLAYREEQAKTTSTWITINGQLDISADKTTASEGVEIDFAGGDMSTAARDQVLEVGTNGGCVAAMVTIARPDMVTQFQLGWRQNEAFQDAAAYTGYAVWNSVGLTTNNGAITSSGEVSSSTTTDLSGVTWANAERRALKVCLNSGGVPSAFYSDASPDNESPIYHPITMTTSGVTDTAGIGAIPFLTFLAAGTTDAGITIQWVELSYNP